MWRFATLALLGCGRFDFAEQPSGAFRKPITIDRVKVDGGPHVGFPLLVELATDLDLAANARDDGFDIAFSLGGVALPYERELYQPAIGALVAWVRLPALDAIATTTIDMTFGDPNAVDQQAPAAVWDASYQAVWHGATTRDSTSHHNDGIAMGGLGVAPGTINTALSYDGSSAMFAVPASPSLSSAAAAGTFSLWIRWTAPARGAYQMVLSSSNRFVMPPRDGFEWANQAGGEHYFYPWGGSETAFDYVVVPPFTPDAWQYLAVTLDYASKTLLIYLDATPLTTTHDGETGWAQIAQPGDWLWGGNPLMGGPNYFLGAMEELRVASVVRSPEWLATEHANQASPSTFYTVGAVTSSSSR